MARLILTQHQLNKLESSIENISHKRLFAIARYSGQIVRSILHLQMKDVYNDVNVPDKTINFLDYRGSVFCFTIPVPLSEALAEYSPRFLKPEQPLVHARYKPDHAVGFANCDKVLRHYSNKCGYSKLNVSYKMIRDSLIVHLSESGLSDYEIQTYLGLTTPPIILKKHPIKPQSLLEKVNKVFGF